MSFQDEEIQTVIRLGLTFCQAKIYLALTKSGTSTARNISKITGVARPEIYRIMPELQKIGLVEKILSLPSKFKAAPIQEGVLVLLDRKEKEAFETRKAARALVRKFKQNEVKTTIQENEQFILIPERERVAKIREKLIAKTLTSIDIVTFWKRYAQAMGKHEKSIKKALKRGVHIRIITEKIEDEELAQKKSIEREFDKYPSFEMRHTIVPIDGIFVVYDKKETLLFTSKKIGLDEAAALYSTNPHLVSLAKNYFAHLWKESTED